MAMGNATPNFLTILATHGAPSDGPQWAQKTISNRILVIKLCGLCETWSLAIVWFHDGLSRISAMISVIIWIRCFKWRWCEQKWVSRTQMATKLHFTFHAWVWNSQFLAFKRAKAVSMHFHKRHSTLGTMTVTAIYDMYIELTWGPPWMESQWGLGIRYAQMVEHSEQICGEKLFYYIDQTFFEWLYVDGNSFDCWYSGGQGWWAKGSVDGM